MASLARLARIPVNEIKLLGGKRGDQLRRSGIRTVADLLTHVPRTYADRSRSVAIADIPINQEVTVFATVESVSLRRPRRNLTIVEARVTDGKSFMKAVWFNQGFRAKQLTRGSEVALGGKVERFNRQLQMKSPEVDVLSSPSEAVHTRRIVPIHPVVYDIKAGMIRRAMHTALTRASPISDAIPADVVRRVGVAERDWAYWSIHFPDTLDDLPRARERLVFDELFRLEVALASRKKQQEAQSQGIKHEVSSELVERFLSGLPYELTGAQRRVLAEIRTDLGRRHAMHRLLQGEVGSGKTVVAVATLLHGITGGWQGAVMAPTEVLAEQHYLAIADLLQSAGLEPEIEGEGATRGMRSLFESGDRPAVRLALLTGSRAILTHRPGAGRADILGAIASGEVELVVGTHALIQEGVEFSRLGIAVVDEQHRFGVAQRVQLRDKADEADPDLLIMTATPIPRTLSMTLYGDLDVSLIDEMPPGRSPVATTALLPAQEGRAWDVIRAEVERGRQAYVVCPLVEDSPKVEAASVAAEYERLQEPLAGLRLGQIHGQLHPRDKEQVMGSFRAGEIDVLVATTVIEVGIDVPNATVIVIEDADHFGLSQLHQLRGRVGRGIHAGRCFLIADPSTEEASERIEAMVATNDGYELANADLRIRGQGTVFGMRQSGMTDLRLADVIADFAILEKARREAFALVDVDPTLEDHPELVDEITAFVGEDVDWLFEKARG